MKEQIDTGIVAPRELDRLHALYQRSSTAVGDFRAQSFDLPQEAITWMAGGCFAAVDEQQMSAAV